MNPLSKAIDEIKFRIPRQLLDVAFRDELTGWRRAPVSLDEQILHRVIRPRVLVDCNLVGGQMALIPLEGLPAVYADQFSVVYQIPKTLTLNRSIVSVLSLSYLPFAGLCGPTGSNYNSLAGSLNSPVTMAAQQVANSFSEVPPVSVGYVELVGENTVMFRDSYRVTQAYYLRCILANEENLNNINPRSYPAFSRLCELAVRSYVYNTLIVRIDQAYLQGGQELGVFKSIVEGMADSEELYQTHLREVWRAVAFANDIQSYDRFIKLQLNSAI